MYILLVFLALGSVSTHDINVGSSTEGKKVFDEHFQASPAVWKQAQNVTVNTTDDEVISRIVVTDLREDKDGDAKIVDGGEGQKKVTIELKSPTLLRGYDFHVEVYAASNKEYQNQRNGPVHPSEFKSNADSLNTPYSGSKITPQSSVDSTTKLSETPKIQSNPTSTEPKQSKARLTRDTEVKRPEENSPKIESPSIFGQKAATTTEPGNKDSNIPVTIANRQLSKYNEDDEKTIKSPTLKTSKDEVRHVRDTHKEVTTTKSPLKYNSYNSRTTTTTNKTPNYNLNRNNPVPSPPMSVANAGRDARAPQKDEGEHVSPTLISSQRNPTVYTPNLNRNVPSYANSDKDKPTNDQSKTINQKRSVRDTKAEAKEINAPKINGLTNLGNANNHGANVTDDEERKTRSAQEGLKITPFNVDIKEVTSTTASTIPTKQDDQTSVGTTDRRSSLTPPGVLTKSQNYPVPYPYEATTKVGSITKSSFKRDTESQEPQTDTNVKLSPKTFGTSVTSPKIASTTKSPVKRDTESSTESKADDKNAKLNPKSFGAFDTTTKVATSTKSPVKRDTESSTESKVDDKNAKLNPKSFGAFDTTTKVATSTKSPVKRDTESSTETEVDDKNAKLNPKSFGAFETTTKVASTTKSPVKRHTQSLEKADEDGTNAKLNPKSSSTFETSTKVSSTTNSPHKRDTKFSEESKFDDKVIPKVIGSQNSTSHDHKVPVVSIQ